MSPTRGMEPLVNTTVDPFTLPDGSSPSTNDRLVPPPDPEPQGTALPSTRTHSELSSRTVSRFSGVGQVQHPGREAHSTPWWDEEHQLLLQIGNIADRDLGVYCGGVTTPPLPSPTPLSPRDVEQRSEYPSV